MQLLCELFPVQDFPGSGINFDHANAKQVSCARVSQVWQSQNHIIAPTQGLAQNQLGVFCTESIANGLQQPDVSSSPGKLRIHHFGVYMYLDLHARSSPVARASHRFCFGGDGHYGQL